jgi:hypothetical protein
MLFLLRKIRNQMIHQGKVWNYLLYAIGEIFLVVIGILVAVQIDDWNEGRKLRDKEAEYYCKLLEDVLQDEQQLDRLITETDHRIYHSNMYLSLLQKEKLDHEAISNEMLQSISLVTFTFKPSISAFEDIKSSGNLSLLRDEEIKKSLVNYYAYIEGIVDVVDINSDQSVRLNNQKDNYVSYGWHLIGFINEAIDPELVDKQQLNKYLKDEEKYRESLTSDAVYFIGSSARVKMLYLLLGERVKEMKMLLANKCNAPSL